MLSKELKVFNWEFFMKLTNEIKVETGVSFFFFKQKQVIWKVGH